MGINLYNIQKYQWLYYTDQGQLTYLLVEDALPRNFSQNKNKSKINGEYTQLFYQNFITVNFWYNTTLTLAKSSESAKLPHLRPGFFRVLLCFQKE